MFGVLLWISPLLWSEIFSPLCVRVCVWAESMCTLCIHMYYANAVADFITIHVWLTQLICFVARKKQKRSYVCVRTFVCTCMCGCDMLLNINKNQIVQWPFEWIQKKVIFIRMVTSSWLFFFLFFFLFFQSIWRRFDLKMDR